MKFLKYLALAVLVACSLSSAYADNDPPGYADKGSLCMSYGKLFTNAAVLRDAGNPPQYAFQWIMKRQQPRAGGNFSIDQSQVKTAINLVYFDPALAPLSGGPTMSGTIFNWCMRDFQVERFQPLQ